MKYTILYAGDLETLATSVNKCIAAGWSPQGGVAPYTVAERDGYGNTFYYNWYAQALITTDE